MSDRQMSVETLIESHPALGLDSNVLIYLLEDAGALGDIAALIVDAIEERRVRGTLASVGLAEILAGPATEGDSAMFEQIAAELRELHVAIVSLTAELAADAAWLRGRRGLGLIDAIHLASARSAGATVFLTNDRRIGSSPGLEVVFLEDLAPAAS